MHPVIFREIWGLPDKCINDDIVFLPMKGFSETHAFSDVGVLMTSEHALAINGHYNCRTGAITYNVVVVGTGAICRYDLGGTSHGPAGRYHSHSVKRADDVRRKLPNVDRRDDLRGLTAKQAWDKLCEDAKITHTGTFFEPEELCR
jgi:hypothetical protein